MVFLRWQPCGRGKGPDLVVASGDLTTAPVDAVVSSSGPSLSCGSGVGAAIVAIGGSVVEEDCEAWILQNQYLSVGEATTTHAGKLPCGYVIHVAGPSLRGRRGKRLTPTPEESQHLRDAVRSALDEADRLKLASIAMPAISSGNFRYPKDLATTEIVDACVAFASEKKKKTTVKSIVLMDIDSVAYGYFVDALWEAALEDGKQPQSLKKLAFDNRFAQMAKLLFDIPPLPLSPTFERLSTKSAEYKTILAELPHGLASQVKSIRRVRSFDRCVAYEAMKVSIKMQGAHIVEVEPLYHGTPARWRATSIAMDGFDLCYCENGRTYGDGVYTSSDVGAAIGYADSAGSVLRLRGLVVSKSSSCGYNTVVKGTTHVFPTPNALLSLVIIDFGAENKQDRKILQRR